MHYKLIIYDNNPWMYTDMAHQIIFQLCQTDDNTAELIDYETGQNTDKIQYIFLGTMYKKVYVSANSIITNFDSSAILFDILTPELINTCIIWDYSRENIDLIHKKYPNARCYLFEMGYAKPLDHGLKYVESDKDIDVLFLGGESDRRVEILERLEKSGCKVVREYRKIGDERAELYKRSKVVLSMYGHYWRHTISASRLTPSLCNNCFVISENCTNIEQNNHWKKYVLSVNYDKIVDTILEYLDKPLERKEWADRAYDSFKKTVPRIIPVGYNCILVTGSNGMVGKALREWTKEDTRYVFVGKNDADLSDLQQTRILFNKIKPDAVIHLAAVVGGLFYNIQNNALMLDINTRINLNVSKCAVESGVRKVIMVNSTCAFPAFPAFPVESTQYPLTEKDLHSGPVHYSNEGYGASKRISEIISRLYSESTQTKFVTVYPCNLYGVCDNFDIASCHVLSGLIAKAYSALVTEKDMVVYGTGNPLRQFLYVEDMARLLVMILEQFEGSSMILSPDISDELSINDLALKTSRIVENYSTFSYKRINIVNDLSKSDGLYKKTVTNKLLRSVFPYFQFTSLENGIRKTYEWYIKNKTESRLLLDVIPRKHIISGNLPDFLGLAGGIGNQLFLVSSVMAIAWDNSCDVVLRFDKRHKYRFENDYRENLLKQFKFTDNDITDYNVIKQSDIPYEKGIAVNSNSIIEGYFQSPLYFIRYADRIRKIFNISDQIPQVLETVRALRNSYIGKKIITVQVRRGDYKSLGWTLQTHYYKNAMSLMGEEFAFVISTDDKTWCSTIFPGIPILYCPDDWIEFLLLCNLDGIVMSNSTFGWWAAFLGNLQYVTAPKPWFKNNKYDETLYLEHWKKLEW